MWEKRANVKGRLNCRINITCAQAYILLWVCDGFTLDNRKRAWKRWKKQNINSSYSYGKCHRTHSGSGYNRPESHQLQCQWSVAWGNEFAGFLGHHPWELGVTVWSFHILAAPGNQPYATGPQSTMTTNETNETLWLVSIKTTLIAYLSMVDENLEESVTQEDPVWFDAACIQQHRLETGGERTWGACSEEMHVKFRYIGLRTDLWWTTEAISIKDGLDHDEALSKVFIHQGMSGMEFSPQYYTIKY